MTSPARPLPPPFQAGFTLVELLVAMFISLIIVWVVVYLFSQVQRAAGMSLGHAKLTLVGTSIESRMRMDFANLGGPDRAGARKGGCITIVPALRQGYLPLPSGQMSKNKIRLRQDQLAFISNRDPAQAPPWNNPDARQSQPWVSLHPQQRNGDIPAVAPSSSTSWEAKVWYGPVRNGHHPAGDGSNADLSLHAHLWMLGRQAKLMTGGAGIPDVSVDVNSDVTAGTLLALKNDAVSNGWTDGAYVSKLAVAPNANADFTNQPVATPRVDLKALQSNAEAANGIQLSDVDQSSLVLCSNCSEVVVQWAGDLDKDGKIDVYPLGHPLQGAMIWYPEELHNKGAWYNGATGPRNRTPAATRLSAELNAMYGSIIDNDWSVSGKTFPAGFMPALSAWPNGRFGAMPASGNWVDRFQIDYGERDNFPNPTIAPDGKVPAPYVFRFEDDQYRLVRYGFRQDGGVYANKWDGKPLPNLPGGGKHWFPYPPNPWPLTEEGIHGAGGSMGYTPTINPSFPQLYNGRAAPLGPYPRAGATPAAADYSNFGDALGAAMLPVFWSWGTANGMVKNLITANDFSIPAGILKNPLPNWCVRNVDKRYRTSGNGIADDPGENGRYVRITLSAPADIPPQPHKKPPTVTLSLVPLDLRNPTNNPTGDEPLWPYRQGNNLVAINQMGEVIASVALDADDLKTEPAFTTVFNPTIPEMAQRYAADANYTTNYTDLYAEYLKNLNAPAATYDPKADWRNPQSDWPRLIRIRLRLHDERGLVSSYSDEFLINGRDDDGDGRVDNPEEGRMSGMWFEYVFSIPYPHDPAPRVR